MKVIFLDIDGVLNNASTKVCIEGTDFVEDEKVLLLKELIDQTGAKVVLSSTWRSGWEWLDHKENPNESERQDIRLFEALKAKLQEFGIELMDYTGDFGKRGEEIDAWLRAWQGDLVEAFVILDDMDDRELRPHSRYLIQTGFWNGLEPKHVQRAIKILNTKE